MLMYLLFLAPGILLAMWAQMRMHSAYAQASRYQPRSGLSGAEAAAAMLETARVGGVRIEPVQGFLSDHYVPGERVLRLSPGVYAERSLAALGIAAHEAGHAIQDATRYPMLVVRNLMVGHRFPGGFGFGGDIHHAGVARWRQVGEATKSWASPGGNHGEWVATLPCQACIVVRAWRMIFSIRSLAMSLSFFNSLTRHC